MILLLLLILFLHLLTGIVLRTYVKNPVLMPDGRTWTGTNLRIPLLGYRNPEAPKEEGRLYKFPAVKLINFSLWLFAVGWHIPTDKEWETLLEACGADAFKKLTAKELGGTDEFGFRVLPAGYRYNSGSFFNGRGYYAYFWSSSANSSTYAWYRGFYYNYATVFRNYYNRSYGFSVRLIKNKR